MKSLRPHRWNISRILSCCVLLVLPQACYVNILGIGAGIGVRSNEAGEDEQGQAGIRVDQHLVDLQVNEDLTWSSTIVTRQTLMTPGGVSAGQSAAMTFHPATQTLDVEEAYVLTPAGHRVSVDPDFVFTRPSAAAEGAPGFINSMTATILFPQLTVGCQTYVRWNVTERGQPPLGLNYAWWPALQSELREARITISHPASLRLHHGVRDMEVQERREGEVQVVEATLRNHPGFPSEPAMVSARDTLPVFAITSLESWEETGRRFHASFASRVADSQSVRDVADQVAAGLEGLEATQALYRWVCRNIHYVTADLTQAHTWVPNDAEQVLAQRFGDCKDQTALLAALLKARGIRSEPVLVGWDSSFEPLPIWSALQFNHCMLYLPDFDLYANPTSPFADLGTLEQKLSGKLVVHAGATPRVRATPEAQVADHSYQLFNDATLDRNGSWQGTTRLEFTGRPAAFFRAMVAEASSGANLAGDMLVQSSLGGHGELESSDPTALDTQFQQSGTWSSEQVVEMGPEVYFSIPPGIDPTTPQQALKYIAGGARRFPVLVATVSLHWNHRLTLPGDITVKRLPPPVLVQTDAGSYSARYDLDEQGRITVDRFLQVRKDRFAPSETPELHRLLSAVVRDLGGVVVGSHVSGE